MYPSVIFYFQNSKTQIYRHIQPVYNLWSKTFFENSEMPTSMSKLKFYRLRSTIRNYNKISWSAEK